MYNINCLNITVRPLVILLQHHHNHQDPPWPLPTLQKPILLVKEILGFTAQIIGLFFFDCMSWGEGQCVCGCHGDQGWLHPVSSFSHPYVGSRDQTEVTRLVQQMLLPTKPFLLPIYCIIILYYIINHPCIDIHFHTQN